MSWFTLVVFHWIFILLSAIVQRHSWLLLLSGLMTIVPSFASTEESSLPFPCTLNSGGMKCWESNDNVQYSSTVDVRSRDTNTPPIATVVSISLNPFGVPANNVSEVFKGSYTYNDAESDIETGSTFQWYQATDSVCTADKMAISGATAQTYTVASNDVGKYLCFGVTPKNVNGIGTEVLTATVSMITRDKLNQNINTLPENSIVEGAMSNYNQTASHLIINENSSVSGGVLAGDTINNGLVANVTIAPNSTIIGGKLSGYNTNLGTLNDVTISQYSEVRYGNYTGTTQNDGSLINPIVSPTGTIINNGTLENPILLPGANVSGGKISSTIILLGGTYDSEIQPDTRVITHVQDIPPQIFDNFNEQTLNILPPTIVSQITPEQFAQIPIESLSGLSSENIGAISPQVIQTLNNEQINVLDMQEFQTMPAEGVAKLLTNFDVEQITPQEAKKLLPPQWRIDQHGNLTAPPGTHIALKTLALADVPVGLKLPDTPDLNSSFALGGKGVNPLIKQINQVANTKGFITTQQKTGVIHVQELGATGIAKQQFSFMVNPDQIFVLDKNTPPGLKFNEQGQYIVVTEDSKQIPIIPMTKAPEALLAVLGENTEIDIQKTGEVFIKYSSIIGISDKNIVNSVGVFDPFIEPAPEDICQEAANGEMQCDWSKASAAQHPGLRTTWNNNSRTQSVTKITYPDGTAQKIYPAVLFPDIFVAEVQKMAGVEKAIFRMDGIIAVTYQGSKLWLIPTFEAQVQPIPPGKRFKPSLILEKGTLTYRVPYGDNLVTSQLSIIEAPSP